MRTWRISRHKDTVNPISRPSNCFELQLDEVRESFLHKLSSLTYFSQVRKSFQYYHHVFTSARNTEKEIYKRQIIRKFSIDSSMST